MPFFCHPIGRLDYGSRPELDMCCLSTLSGVCILRSFPFPFLPSRALLFARVVRFARNYRLSQLAIFANRPRTIAGNMLARFRSGKPGQRLVLSAAIACATSRDQVARIVAAASAVRDQVVERDVTRINAVKVAAAIQASEAVAQVDSEAKVSADAHTFVFAVRPSIVCCLMFAHCLDLLVA